MDKYRIALATILVAGGASAHAATIEVGAGKKYKTLAAAAAATRSGDTVIVYPGTYTSGAVWTASNITIRQPLGTTPGKAILRGAVSGKGIFVTKGSNITIDGLRFEYANVSSANGAGIRAEGKNLTVRNSYFYKNQSGILATPYSSVRGTLRVENSTFNGNGTTSGQAHSIYANYLDKVIVTGSKFMNGSVGHYVKSRAYATEVTNSTIDDTYGKASYLIDLPWGGAAKISNNILIKGANASNCCTAIAIGFEGNKNPAGAISVTSNKFTNKRASTVSFVNNRTTTSASVTGNTLTVLAGKVKTLTGPGTVGSTTVKTAAMQMIMAAPVDLEFADLGGYAVGDAADGLSMADLGGTPDALQSIDSSGFDILVDGASIAASAVPEPSMLGLIGLGSIGLLFGRRRRQS